MRKGRTILAVDDEPKILEALAAFLLARGYEVRTAQTGKGALEQLDDAVDLVILDLMLPDMPGEEVCAAVRRRGGAGVIMLTAKSSESDLLEGLSAGADDYMTKPFSLRELEARVEAVLRRSAPSDPLFVRNVWGDGDLAVDFGANTVTRQGRTSALTASERGILSTLMRSPGRVFSRAELLDAAFGPDFDGYDRVIDTHIKNLRQKLGDNPRSPAYILTVHGIGYRFGGKS